MFEKRTKNVKIKDNCTSVLVNVDSDPKRGNIETVAVCYQGFDLDGTKEEAVGNAEFICFCFNLQQKYDIGLFEKLVVFLEDALSPHTNLELQQMESYGKQLLNDIKQNK